MWTERAKVIKDIDEIIRYMETVCFFHDYRLGNIQTMDSSMFLTVEEDTGKKHNDNAHIWNFSFGGISDMRFEIDCALSSYITEIEIKEFLVTIGLTNGYISFRTTELSLGIPSF